MKVYCQTGYWTQDPWRTSQVPCRLRYGARQPEGWWHRQSDYHLQYSSDWHSQDTWETMSQKKALGNQRCSRPLWWTEGFDEEVVWRWYEEIGAKEYRKANKRVQKALMKAKEDWMDNHCKKIGVWLNKNNSKKAYRLVKDLTSEKQGRSTTIQDKSGKCLTEEQEILSRWAEYCSELYNYESYGDNTVLGCSQHPGEDLQPILHEEVEIAIAALKMGKSAGVDNIPAELVPASGESVHDWYFDKDQ